MWILLIYLGKNKNTKLLKQETTMLMNQEKKSGIINHKNKMVQYRIITQQLILDQTINGMGKIQNTRKFQILD